MNPSFATDKAGEVAFRTSRIESITLVESEEDHREALVQLIGDDYPHKVTHKQAKELIASLEESGDDAELWEKVLYLSRAPFINGEWPKITLDADLKMPGKDLAEIIEDTQKAATQKADPPGNRVEEIRQAAEGLTAEQARKALEATVSLHSEPGNFGSTRVIR